MLGEERRGPRARCRRDTCAAPARRRRPCRDAARYAGRPAGRATVARGSTTTSFAPACRASLMKGIEVDARGRRIHAPEHDQPRVHVVLVGDARHLAVETHVGRAGCRRAHGPRETRGAEPAPQRRIVGVLREEPVRSAVAERQDGLGARAIANRHHPLGDVIQRFIPADAGEDAVALRALPNRRVEEAVLAVHALGEAPHLAADVAAGDRVLVAAVDFDDAALLDRDVERAGVGAVERAGGLDRRVSPGFGLCGASHMRRLSHGRRAGRWGPSEKWTALH